MSRIIWNVQPVSSYGLRILRRVILHGEIHIRDGAERLIAADDVIARLHGNISSGERGICAADFESLMTQIVYSISSIGLAALTSRNHPAVHRSIFAFVDRALVLEPVVV